MGRMKIQVFGPFKVSLDDQPLTQFDTEKTRALLAYLACESGHPHQREYLAEIFWPERPPGTARANLRHALSILRKLVGDPPPFDRTAARIPFLLVTRDAIHLNLDSKVWVDQAAFTALLSELALGADNQSDQLEQAVRIYRGPLLEDLSLKDSAQFQNWLLARREQLRRMALSGLSRLAKIFEQSGDYERALHHARRYVEIDPWDERARRQLMRLLVFTGQRNAALAEYESWVHALEDELGVEPEPDTLKLCQYIRESLLANSSADHQLPAFMQEAGKLISPQQFVAREKELSRLHAFLARTLGGRGGMAFISGGPGQGKTALLGEFTRQVLDTHRNLLVAAGYCSAISGVGNPYMPFRQALSMLTGDVEGRWAASLISRNHARRLWSAMPVVIPALLGTGPSLIGTLLSGEVLLRRMKGALIDQPEWQDHLQELIERKKMGGGDLDQRFLFDQYGEVLSTVANQLPFVLLLDDIQWMDMASIDLLFHLARRLASASNPLLIICAYRPEEITSGHAGDRHPLERILQEIECIFGEVWVDLDNVGEFENRHFVNAFLDTERNRFSVDFREKLFRRTGGHPLFTIELLRVMHERGEVVPDMHADGAWIEGPSLNWNLLPTRVEAVIESRILRLNPELKEILSIASIEGDQFTVQVVTAVQNDTEISILRGLRKLEKLYRLVKEIGEFQSGDVRVTRYQFSHILVREYVYQQLSLGEQRILHGQVARALVDQYGNQLDEIAAQLAHHFYKAGIYDLAYQYAVMAAQKAAGAFAHSEAVTLYTLAIELAPKITLEGTALVDLFLKRGRAVEILGDFDRARVDYETALERSRAGGLQHKEWSALLNLAELWTSRDYDRSLEYIDLALDLAQRIEEPALLASSLNWVGNWHTNAENPARALGYHQKALQVFEQLKAEEEIAATLDRLGITSMIRGDMIAGVAYYDRAIALFREQNDRIGLASSLTGRGLGSGGPGLNQTSPAPAASGSARSDLTEALQIARQTRSPSSEAWALWSLCLLNTAHGRFGEALDCIRNALEIASSIGHLEWIAGSHSNFGLLYTEMLAPEAAQPHLDRALALAQQLRSQHWFHHASGISAAAWCLLGKLDQALACLMPAISRNPAMDTINRRLCWGKRAELALFQGDLALALDIAERLIASIPGRMPGQVTPYLWQLQGDALAALGRAEEALPLLQAALDNAQATGARGLSWRIHASLGRLHAAIHHDGEKEHHMASARQLIHDLAQTIPEEALRNNFLDQANRLIFSMS
jgi:DNA-binding SARP family transcriptional activator